MLHALAVLLAYHAEELGATNRAGALNGITAILHRDILRIFYLPLLAALDAIRFCRHVHNLPSYGDARDRLALQCANDFRAECPVPPRRWLHDGCQHRREGDIPAENRASRPLSYSITCDWAGLTA